MNTFIILLDLDYNFLEIVTLMFGSFLIGYFFNRYYFSKKYKEQLEYFKKKCSELEEENLTTIRAVKTVSRSGETIAYIKPDTKLKFNSKDEITNLFKQTIGIKNDLKKIKGIGPLIEAKLNKLGITTFEQISNLNKKQIDLINIQLKFSPKRIENAKWQAQAKKLIKTTG